MSLHLRPYQLEAVTAAHDANTRDVQKIAIGLPTGTGKTLCFSKLIEERGHPALILAHRDELIQQAVEKYQMIDPTTPVGIVKAGLHQADLPVVVGSVQTLARKARLDRMPMDFKTLVVDECFPAGTLVDGREIQNIRTGDEVLSYDETTDLFVLRSVLRTMQRRPSSLVRITVEGRVICCTPEHPFLTTRGWVAASRLAPGTSLISWSHHDVASTGHLRRVRYLGSSHQEREDRRIQAQRSSVLRRRLPGHVGVERRFAENGTDESGSRLETYARTQSNEQARCQSETLKDTARHGSWAPNQRRQWETTHSARGDDDGLPRAQVGTVDRSNRAEGHRRPSFSLQGRHRERGAQDCDRDRRKIPLGIGTTGARCEENRMVGIARVDSVEVLEPGCDGSFGGVCPDGLVYNLEVEDTHTYLVEGVVVHNCHHAVADTYRRILTHFEDVPMHSFFSATLERGDKKSLGKVIDEIVYYKSLLEMIEAGYLVDIRSLSVRVKGFNTGLLKVVRGDFQGQEIAEALTAAGAEAVAVRAWLDHAQGRKTILFAATVESAMRFAEAFNEAGIPATTVYGELDIEIRRERLRAFANDEYMVISNCAVLTEGYDEPSVSCIMSARPTRSKPLFIQMVGRGTRLYPGKQDLLVIDLVGNDERVDLVSIPKLFGLDPDKVKDEGLVSAVVEHREQQRLLPNALAGLATLELDVKETNLFDRKDINWLKLQNGNWFLSGAKGTIFLEQQEGKWNTVLRPRDKAIRPIVYGTGYDLAMAMGIAEEEIVRKAKEDTLRYIDKTQKWRAAPATEKQKNLLKDRNVPVVPGLTAGDASDMISAMMALRA